MTAWNRLCVRGGKYKKWITHRLERSHLQAKKRRDKERNWISSGSKAKCHLSTRAYQIYAKVMTQYKRCTCRLKYRKTWQQLVLHGVSSGVLPLSKSSVLSHLLKWGGLLTANRDAFKESSQATDSDVSSAAFCFSQNKMCFGEFQKNLNPSSWTSDMSVSVFGQSLERSALRPFWVVGRLDRGTTMTWTAVYCKANTERQTKQQTI